MNYPVTPRLHLIAQLANRKPNLGKIVLLIMDGLGGIASGPGGKTELETAQKPNLDRLARAGSLAGHDPIGPGFTPGSGIAHLSLFGYDPLVYEIGRGVLALFGARCFDADVMQPGEVAARVNFCAVEEKDGRLIVTDRRAGRIKDGPASDLVDLLNAQIKVDGVSFKFWHSKEHRAVLHLHGQGWSGNLIDTDPQATGVAPLDPAPTPEFAADPAARKTAAAVAEILQKAREALKDKHPANFILTRGFDTYKEFPHFTAQTGMKAACIAAYPDYRGVARLLGFEVVPNAEDIANRGKPAGERAEIAIASEFDTLERVWNDYDFFFMHIKKTDSYGEDGNFDAKVKIIEQVDEQVARIEKLGPAVLVVTGDHSTPAAMKTHSFHPVPVLFHGKLVIPDDQETLGERACARGGHGRLHGTDLLPLMMAYAGRLAKLGA
ncbi:MAG: 2,3-bisphosphoglycerate-independent phosphoglycerate mutase [Myxococcales bacterium]|nr:2,3-bisphosphoglycerate-independent phosphoglycerate mutase [Myxococcales bacterium]